MSDSDPTIEGVEGPTDLKIEIIGGAGPYEAAAIMAAIDAVLTEEENTQAIPDLPATPGSWAMSGRPQIVLGPKTTFQGLSPSPGSDDDNGDSGK
jgi:hypothetical protein